jgi:hypothetical protein
VLQLTHNKLIKTHKRAQARHSGILRPNRREDRPPTAHRGAEDTQRHRRAVLTPEVLFEVINAKGVIADTIFQAVMSVEKGLWNVSQPDKRSLPGRAVGIV